MATTEKHTQLVNSFTTSLQTSRTATRVARSHVTKVLFDAFSYKLLKTWKQTAQKLKERENIWNKCQTYSNINDDTPSVQLLMQLHPD
jgi:monoamine oxidase